MKHVVLIILDGFGVGKNSTGNAILQAKTPAFDYLAKNFKSGSLKASGIAVGLPFHEPGNSEVGHITIGAGRILYQSLQRISFAIKDKTFFKNPVLIECAEHVRANGSTLHLVGLVSSGSVHSYLEHLYALIDFAKEQKIEKLVVHAITDGRDAPPDEDEKILKELNDYLLNISGRAVLGSVVGRSYAMDRDGNWENTRLAYELLTEGKGIRVENIPAYLKESYQKGIYDDAIAPAILETKEGGVDALFVRTNDALLFFNFREDSARQLSKAFVAPEFNEFPRKKIPNLYFATMTSYETNLPAKALFPPISLKNGLAEVVAKQGLAQLRIAETDKYAHVTYFFNLGEEKSFPEEERILIPSLDMGNIIKEPRMRADEITAKLIEEIRRELYPLIVVNFANADMLGHTGDLAATIRAVEALDDSIKKIMDGALEKDIALIITSDHGNAEDKINVATGDAKTEHSTNNVPVYIVGKEFRGARNDMKRGEFETVGFLSDIAPTILEIMKIPKPKEMTGISLLGRLK